MFDVQSLWESWIEWEDVSDGCFFKREEKEENPLHVSLSLSSIDHMSWISTNYSVLEQEESEKET